MLSSGMRSKASFILVFLFFELFAQKQALVIVDQKNEIKITANDSSEVSAAIQDLLKNYWSEGFLFAGIDSMMNDTVYLHKGKSVIHSSNQSWERSFRQAQQTVKGLSNNGYPFAKYSWDSLRLNNDELSYKIRLDSGPYILFDSLILLTNVKTKADFISRSLGISKLTPFSESAFRSIPQKIQRINYLTIRRPPDVSFQSGKAWTYLELEEGTTGSFQGILGVLPNQATGQGVLITGNIDLKLLNLFRSGKELNLSWAQFAEQSQRLNTSYRHPYIAGTSIHLNAAFKLFKQDTSFLNRETSISGSFFISSKLEMGFGYQQQNATVLTSQVSRIVERNWLDFRQDWYFWQIVRGRNQIVRAEDSFTFIGDLAIGHRQVSRNISFPQEVYDTVKLSLTNFKFQSDFNIQRRISKQLFFFGSLELAHISNSTTSNQQYRIGGLQSFRGFNEQFFYTPSYAITQIETRLFFEEQSYVFAFYDHGLLSIGDWIHPFGIGGGFSLFTNSGLFSFAMAVGRSNTIPFELANMKIHFGYLSRF